MISLLRFDRRLLLPVLLGASACRVPGEDWVDPSAGMSTAGGNTANGTPTVGGTETTANTATTAATVTNGGDTTTDTVTSGGGSGSTSDGGATSTSDDTSDTTTDGSGGSSSASTNDTSTTGAGGTGGVPEGSLIDNGDFSDGATGWEIEGNATVDASSGEFCMTLNNQGTVHLDWPTEFEPASLMGGTSYVFSYVVYYSGEKPTVNVKLGQPVEPYNAFAEDTVDVTTSPEKFTQTFDMDADDRAGIRFSVDGQSGTKVCIDNVALVAE